jgi:hypothetical protein
MSLSCIALEYRDNNDSSGGPLDWGAMVKYPSSKLPDDEASNCAEHGNAGKMLGILKNRLMGCINDIRKEENPYQVAL